MRETIVEIQSNNLEERYFFNKVAKQASGAVMYQQGKAVLIAAVAIDETMVEEEFLPLTVQYIEKSYAAAKIPGGFVKRESKPGDFETLTSRIVDRSLRPLFPEGFFYPVTITITVVSADSAVDMQIAALHAANSALFVSDIPVEKNIAAVRIGSVDSKYIINPTLLEQKKSHLDLLVVGSSEDILMIEMQTMASNNHGMTATNALEDAQLLALIQRAQTHIADATTTFDAQFSPYQRTPLALDLQESLIDEEIYHTIKERYTPQIEEAIASMAKSERASELKKIRHQIIEAYPNFDKEHIRKALESHKKHLVRSMILSQRTRADGRKLDEVRPITIETNLLPSVHGSCLFTRGQTQVLVTTTLGDKKDAQLYERITEKSSLSEKFMLHYNFPPYSVGEAKFIGAPSRRELGHGNLGKRALEPTLPLEYDGTIRLVSEVLESNGSSSMATICGGALALRASQVATTQLVAGIAMGLVQEGDQYAILSDIMGLEDHDGDMDFKIAGTATGTTALQMDIKLGGICLDLLQEALAQASKGKNHILSIMEETLPSITPSPALPTTEQFEVHPSKIVDIIGKAGSTIRDIIERFEVSVDLDRDRGGVKLSGEDQEKVAQAKAHIENIASTPIRQKQEYKVGELYHGKVKRIVDFGLFIEMPDGFDALLHISKISKERSKNLPERYREGDPIEVVVMEQKGKKVELATPDFLA
jgi:polyribonucleotide nucleotidyltransferase